MAIPALFLHFSQAHPYLWLISIEIFLPLVCKSFALLCCVYLRATPIPSVQDAILNLPNPYFMSCEMLSLIGEAGTT